MNKKLIYAIIVVAVVALVVFAFYKSSYAPGTSGTQTPSSSTNVSTNAMTLQGLLALGSSQKCTFIDTTTTNPVSQSVGTVYVSQGQLRGDFSSIVSGETIQSHMIISGDTGYVWTDGMTTGFKMARATLENQQAPGPNQGFDPTKSVNYSCGNWSVDASVFALPAGVQFSDVTNVLPSP